jgi:hypothetical protein
MTWRPQEGAAAAGAATVSITTNATIGATA